MDSIYEYHDSMVMEPNVTQKQDVELSSLQKSGVLGENKCHILDCLYKYPVCNKAAIHRFLHLETEEGKKRASEDLRMLVTLGCVDTITYGTTTIYALSSYTRKEWGEKKKYYVITPNLFSKSEVLECAAVCQWHLSVAHDGDIGKNMVWQEIPLAKSMTFIPSYMEINRGNKYRIFALSSPRGSSASDFVERICSMWGVMEKSVRKGQYTLTVIICSSYREMDSLNNLFQSVEKAQGRTIYYALDENYELNGLCCLHHYKGRTLETIGLV